MLYDVLVAGGGASGMVAAIFAARKGKRVAIIEHKDKIGKKILATGNGKCNYTNLVQEPSCYRGTNPAFAMEVLKQFDTEETLRFFKELGVYPKIKNGYVYPFSEQAASVVDVLVMELRRLGVAVFYLEHIESVKKNKSGNFVITTSENKYEGRNVILATGGCAAKVQGSDGSGYALAKSFGHTIIPQVPALVQLKAEGCDFKTLAGVRVDGKAGIYVEGRKVTEEKGEFLFANYGISGIPVFQMSRYAGEAVMKKKKTELILDLYPDLSENELMDMMKERFEFGKHKTVEEVFTGFMNKKLAYVVIKEARIKPELMSSKIRIDEIKGLVHLIKNLKMRITGTNTFDNAQVSAGGVATDEISAASLESKKQKGLYIVGELLDIDGTCGGYNLQWAWSTGAVAGSSIR
ncbi:MAG: NAD(P)/FAD-dependent oxidoreductase [Lachnospiraceae bacterium]|nr:NAD(P)/FAD-dependent oxidoreductase [Lachnospiraceae bacterium]